MIKAGSWGKSLICKTCKAELLPIDDFPNHLYATYPVCPCLPWPGDLRRRIWFKPDTSEPWSKTEANLRFMSEFYEDLPGPTCQCGASKCGSNFHSSWCPACKH